MPLSGVSGFLLVSRLSSRLSLSLPLSLHASTAKCRGASLTEHHHKLTNLQSWGPTAPRGPSLSYSPPLEASPLRDLHRDGPRWIYDRSMSCASRSDIESITGSSAMSLNRPAWRTERCVSRSFSFPSIGDTSRRRAILMHTGEACVSHDAPISSEFIACLSLVETRVGDLKERFAYFQITTYCVLPRDYAFPIVRVRELWQS